MRHIVLLGDSILDNRAYVGGRPDVVQRLRSRLPADWKASLLAVDGSVTAHIEQQLGGLPADATHLVVSSGGNDALGHAGILQQPAQSVAGVLEALAAIGSGFENHYSRMLDALAATRLAVVVCTVYHGRFEDPQQQRLTRTALGVFNDAILRLAFGRGVPVIDLRLVCTGHGDYANEIEPSSEGGDKISAAILKVVNEHDFGRRRSEVFGYD